jgi:hypothetical protein
MRTRSIAPAVARCPQLICAPSNAGPVGELLGAELEAVFAGHQHVEEDHAGVEPGAELRQRLLTLLGGDDPVAVELEQRLHRNADVLVVIDQQYGA